MTSRQVVNIIKKTLNVKKIGHAGTLDPLATGVLALAVGKATKTVKYIMDGEKKYEFSKNDGKIIGEHNGAYYYTIGQRKGLAVGGYDEPIFVIGINTKSNEIFVGKGKNHPGLIKKAIQIDIGAIICNDTPGFLGNRVGVYSMQVAMTEALRMKLSIEEADTVFGRSMGIPKTGVFGLYDLIGIDLMVDVLKSFIKELPNTGSKSNF